MSDDRNICQSCGQRLGYRSAVSRGTVVTLEKVKDFVEKKGINAVHIEKELVQQGILTGNQGGNAKGHMVRLGLLAHVGEPGNYCLTTRALEFLAGAPIPKEVVVRKRTEAEGSHTEEPSAETCTIGQFRKKGDYWEVPGFEIREGRVIETTPRGRRVEAGALVKKVAVRMPAGVRFVPEHELDAFMAANADARLI